MKTIDRKATRSATRTAPKPAPSRARAKPKSSSRTKTKGSTRTFHFSSADRTEGGFALLQSFQRGFVPSLVSPNMEHDEYTIDLTYRRGRETVSGCFVIDRALALGLVSVIDGGAGLSVNAGSEKGLAHEIAIEALSRAAGPRNGKRGGR